MKIATLLELYKQNLNTLVHYILEKKTKPPKHVLETAQLFLALIPCDDLRKKVEAVIRYAAKLPPAGKAGEKRKPVQLRFR